LIRDQKEAERRKKNAADVAAVVNAATIDTEVVFVIAHQDCDALEPAHHTLNTKIAVELGAVGISNVVPVAPAWEIEAWWFLWPDAVANVNSKWNRLRRKGNHGMIVNAKEALRRDLRNKATRDYEESDSGRIAEQVRALGIVANQTGSSESFRDFAARIDAIAKS
jgi:hypothetical protein